MTNPIPRLPVLDWRSFAGARQSETPCLLTLASTQFTNSGRASILLALEMLGIQPGDKVLVPTYHCPTMIAPIVARGANAVFYPVDEFGAPQLEWIEQNGSQDVCAILVVHFFGFPQPLKTVRQWCDRQGVRLIEDCAHALFGMSDGRPIGGWGDLAIASLTKFLPLPEGGCLVNNTVPGPHPLLHHPGPRNQVKAGFDILHTSVNHGRLMGLGPLLKGLLLFMRQFKKKSGLQSHSSGVSPAEGLTIDVVQSHRELTFASRWIAEHAPRSRIVFRRRAHYLFLTQALTGLAGMHPLRPQLPDNCAPYVFPLWVDHPDPGYAELRQLAFPVSRWDRLWPTVSAIEGDTGIKWSHHILQLACHQDQTLDELRQMVDTLKRIYKPKGVSAISIRSRIPDMAHLHGSMSPLNK